MYSVIIYNEMCLITSTTEKFISTSDLMKPPHAIISWPSVKYMNPRKYKTSTT